MILIGVLTTARSVREHDVKIKINHRVNFHITCHKHVLFDHWSEKLGQTCHYKQSDALIETNKLIRRVKSFANLQLVREGRSDHL